MTTQTKSKLDKLISDGEVQHIHGLIGCCKNYFVLFPNDTQKCTYNPNKPITGKLTNKVSNYLYTNAKMSSGASSSNFNPAPAKSTGKRLTTKTKPSQTSYPATPAGKRLTTKTKPEGTTYGKIHHKSVFGSSF
jgi:hypothetical protein